MENDEEYDSEDVLQIMGMVPIDKKSKSQAQTYMEEKKGK